ncbi:unnamed protein product, partial [Ectocarpus sp. 12 AP-2014]
VLLGGATVSRATLHNAREVEELGLRPGDRVKVRRAGDVIPQVLGLASPPHPDSSSAGQGDDDSPRFAFPTCCPACGTPVVKEE